MSAQFFSKLSQNYIEILEDDIKEVALFYYDHCGPSFCNDLYVSSTDKGNYNYNYCYQDGYEKQIRDTQDNFSIEDYEVFQILKDEV
ncbi:8992_t:CDS:2 [Funneliformis caledonium]|uniref:8992_t:CDS:1 n=1 Tax=Funneliformis caledonium TaxID=1117310 RepID=A0A9N8VQM4_9GLOM|nr:8992_t:CDS:2 [Funneliformis caledonium]